jgi:chemotaxis receptor (MCP) glutamine deamidase CheD
MKLKIKDLSRSSEKYVEQLKKKLISKYGHIRIVPVLKKSSKLISSYLFTSSLASCLAVIIWNKENREAVMVHLTRPQDAQVTIEKMIKQLSHGNKILISQFKAAIIGEGTVTNNPIATVVELVFKKNGITIEVKDLEKKYLKWVLFNIKTGAVISYWAERVETIFFIHYHSH